MRCFRVRAMITEPVHPNRPGEITLVWADVLSPGRTRRSRVVAIMVRDSAPGGPSGATCRVGAAGFSCRPVVKPPMGDCGAEPINVPTIADKYARRFREMAADGPRTLGNPEGRIALSKSGR
jgi:hypothetical protein